MDVNLINPFIQSFTQTLPQIGFQSVKRINVLAIGNTFKYTGVLVNIALIGQYKGAILICMHIDSAKMFASKMMAGMGIADFDDIAQSAISEMGNMVCAGACSIYSTTGIKKLEISPPTLLIVDDGMVKLPVQKGITINFVADDIPVDMFIGISS